MERKGYKGKGMYKGKGKGKSKGYKGKGMKGKGTDVFCVATQATGAKNSLKKNIKCQRD